ncbi:hypothetical protein N1030_01720 [Desulfovibrio mangrovi]|uniref:hypothetical protein n=1 Tax=Desulfovibrio mangrovi TaxID=2976983 RepID=UPI002246648B|nr:hypothetical protein [Desulfovibrio mangrovi]UZP67713.1 hypothetical protein N1030_01720 [Desulfovibrio mangrovi]
MSGFIMTTLTDIARAWAAALTTDAALAAWCEQFGKPLSVFVAWPSGQDREWGRQDAPYVAIMPLGDKSGTDADEHEFELFLHLGLEVHGNVEGVAWKEPKGFSAIEKDFSGLVLEAFAGTDFAPCAVQGETFPAQADFFERDMAITVRVPFTI